MPRKYQNPKLEKRLDVKRPFYFLRVYVPSLTKAGRRRQRIVHQIGFVDRLTVKQAMKARAEYLDVVNSSRFLALATVSFDDLVAKFRQSRMPHFGAGTRARYESQLERHIIPEFQSRPLAEIDKQLVEAFLAKKEKEGLAWWTREGLRSVLASLFSAAKDWKLWEADNPATGVRLGRKKEAREKRLLKSDQIRVILAAVSDRTRLMILTALLVGLRISEVTGLQWGDIDFASESLTVRRRWYRGDLDEPKTEASRRLRALGPLIEDFRRLGVRRQDAFIFSDDGIVPLDERDILRFEIRPALKRLKLYYPGFGWHAFRRANVTLRQTVGGAAPLEAMRAAGHSSVDLTMLYTLTDAERDRSQVQAIFDNVMGIPEVLKQ